MANTVGLRVSIDGDATGAKRAVDDVSSSISKLNGNAKNLPTFMGSQVPGFNSNSRYVPPLTQQSSPYGVNSFYGQTSPGGVLPDGRRMPNSEQKIAQLTEQLAKLGETIKDVNQDLQDAVDNKDVRSEYQLSGTLNNLKASEAQIKNELKGLERERDKGDPGKAIGGYFAAHLATQLAQTFVQGGNVLIGSQKALAGGDALGSAIQKEKGIGQLIGSGVGTALGAVIGSLIAPGFGTAAGAGIGGSVGNFLGGLFGDYSEIDAGYSGQYKKALPSIDSFYQRYGKDIENKNGTENSKAGLGWYTTASDMSIGTGKTTEELMEAARTRGTYGNFSADDALIGGRQDIMWGRFTGADQNNISRMAGLSLRYGGDTKAVQTAYAGLTASGMGKGQFDEFLTSMQRIMEDGIAKGFVRGADEIAGNMTMLSRLSGGSALWTGEQGANRLMKMNEALSSATALRGVEDVISFGAARDLIGGSEENFNRLTGGSAKGNYYTGTYVDEMQLLERGVSAKLLKGQFDAVKAMEGNNVAGQIERYKQMYNLNYTGATQVWKMSQNRTDWDNIENEIKGMQTKPEYQSDSQRLQDVMTKIDTSLVRIGAIKFDQMEIPKLNEVLNEVSAIRRAIAPTESESQFTDNPFIDQTTYNEYSIANYRNRHGEDRGEQIREQYMDVFNGYGIEVGSEADRKEGEFRREFARLSSMGVGATPGVDVQEYQILMDMLAELRRANGRNPINYEESPSNITIIFPPE